MGFEAAGVACKTYATKRLLMQAYMLLGDLDLAKRHYGEALRHDPDHKQAQAAFKAAKALARLRSQVCHAPLGR